MYLLCFKEWWYETALLMGGILKVGGEWMDCLISMRTTVDDKKYLKLVILRC